MLLRVITPAGEKCALECDSVSFNLCDGKNGKQGGSYGVKPQHANAVFALDSGMLYAKLGDKTLLSAKASAGFAEMRNNVLTVNLDHIEL